MNFRKAGLVFSLLLLTFSVSAQTSFSDIVGSQMSVGESLVNFVNAVTTFNLDTPGEVILYVVAPLIGFYFLIKNFLAMGYEMFEDRIDRPEFEKYDELPNGFKAFAMVTSTITVLTLGAAGAGLLLFAGLASILLAALMFAGLFSAQGNNSSENEIQNGNNSNSGSNGNGNRNNGPQQQNSLADTLNSAANLMNNARGVTQNLQQKNQQRNLSQLQDSLQYFEDDMIEEIDYVDSNISSIRSLIQNAEAEFESGSFDKNSFQTVVRRIGELNGTLYNYCKKIEEDMSGPGSRDWNDPSCELKNYHSSVSPPIHEQAELILSQLDSILRDEKVPPSDDSLRKLMDTHLDYLVAVGHFAATLPYGLNRIATDRDTAEKVHQAARNMGKIKNKSGRDEVEELMQLCSMLENKNDPKNLLKEAETLCERELKVDKGEMEFFKKFMESDGNLLNSAEKIEKQLQYYSNIPGSLQSEITSVKASIGEAMNKASRMESEVEKHGKYETESYQTLRKFESMI